MHREGRLGFLVAEEEYNYWRGEKVWTLGASVGYLKLLNCNEELNFKSYIKDYEVII